MKIALDYDGTYTEDPELWDRFIEMAIERGHDVTVVTMRNEDIAPITHDVEADIIYTSLHGKQEYCERDGEHFDIWIDDNPQWVLTDHEELRHTY